MHTTQQEQNLAAEAGFRPIPTRIRGVPPLLIEREALQDPSPAVGEQAPAAADTAGLQIQVRLHELSLGLAKTHRAAAEAYLAQGCYGEALKHLESAVTFAPDNLEYHNQLGFTRYLLGNDRGAVESFERVLSASPANADALFNLGMVLFGLEDYRRAETCFRRAIDSGQPDAETWNNRGVCLYKLGRLAEARSCFEHALELDPSSDDALHNRRRA